MNDITQKGLNTPYDSSFKSIVKKCPRLALFLINEMFFRTGLIDEQYDGSELVELLDKELPDLEKGIVYLMDLRLAVTKKQKRKFHMECQSTADGTIMLRMVRYETSTALEEAVYTSTEITIKIDDSGIVFLRSTRNTPNVMTVRLEVPQGKFVTYQIPVIKMQNYKVEDLIQRKLFILLPFVFFNYELELKKTPHDKMLYEKIQEVYNSIVDTLKNQEDSGILTAYEARILYDAMLTVFSALGKTNQAEQEVATIMGGRILEFSADKYFYAGEVKGRKEGEAKGRKEGEAKGRKEGEAKGRIEGEAKGLKEGKAKGQKEAFTLITKMVAEGKIDELTRAATDEDYRNTLFKAYEIE